MSGMALRPYQTKSVEAVESEWQAGNKRTLLVLPTGCGKTICMAQISKNAVMRGERVLLMAHRGELLDQASDKIKKTTGLGTALEKAESSCLGSFFRIVVGSVQTLQNGKRLSKFSHDYFNTILIDEAHHAVSDSYQRVLDYFPDAKVLGVTATADRADKKNLGSVFDSLAFEYTLPKAIREGYLVPIKAMTIPLDIDLTGVSITAGDFKASDVGTALDPYLDQIVDEMIKRCADRKIVVFLPLVATSRKFCSILNAKGFSAAEVNGESEDRSEILADFDQGKYNVLCNSMLLTEGWDCPSVDCVVVLRATKSRGLYCQMVGRGTRLFEGKKDLLLLDFLWHVERHELCRPACLVSDDQEVQKKMTEKLEESALHPIDPEALEDFDLGDLEKEASADVIQEREEKLANELSLQRKKKARLVDPLQFEMSIGAVDLVDYRPSFGWEMGPASDKQQEALEKLGIKPEAVTSAGKAALLLDRLQKRRSAGLSSPKQIRLLERYGFQHVGAWTGDEASSLISRISELHWRLPAGFDPKKYQPKRLLQQR